MESVKTVLSLRLINVAQQFLLHYLMKLLPLFSLLIPHADLTAFQTCVKTTFEKQSIQTSIKSKATSSTTSSF